MVTLITEQLQNQSLDDPAYHRAFSLSLPVTESQSPRNCWSTYGLIPEGGCWQLYTSARQDDPNVGAGRAPLYPPTGPVLDGDDDLCRLLAPSTSPTAPVPPPPPPKRHCRSLSVPEDLSRCRSAWRPAASKIWTPVKRRSHSGGAGGGACPLRPPPSGGSSSLASSLRSSSSPTFFSLALSADSPLPWSFPGGEDCCCCFFHGPAAAASSCSSSPSPLCALPRPPEQRRFSLSPVHIDEAAAAAAHFLPPAPPPLAGPAPCPLPAPPSPLPSSACSTPCSSRRAAPTPLPRCRSQPCDMRKPGLKRRHAPDPLPCTRPGLDFSKMSQTRSGDPLSRLNLASPACGVIMCGGGGVCRGSELVCGAFHRAFSPADRPGRTSICPLSESEEEEGEEEEGEEEGRRRKSEVEGLQQQCLFERDCTELDLTLIEEN